ncbi:MAG: type II deoxyribonuclease [Crocinitomicaceae bacterium]|nr:type II deoxyribonuclease [Crocinitomicaceae bacterium]|tara:strand:+ start:6722 stop:9817 length:3096 start_codon:yes stop_codon:yes gene_type:complete
MSQRKEQLASLVERYQSFKREGRLNLSSEETIRTWINELLSIFGWDVMDTSQILQEKVLSTEEKRRIGEIGSTSTRPDYTFKLGNQKLTFLDAKAVSVNIETNNASAFQIKSYGWSILAPCTFLTNFEELAVYDCTYVPNQEQPANLGRTYLKIDEYVDNFEVLENHLLKTNIINGNLEKLYSNTLKNVSSIQKLSPDFVFAEQLSKFRLSLAKNIVVKNTALIDGNTELLSYLTQVIINRIIFIRICEARRIEREGLLLSFLENDFWASFKTSSYNEFFEHYDGPLFDRINDLQSLEIDNAVIKELINLLYYPSPYRFEVIPTKLLSDIYEIFLSKKLVIEDGEVSEKLKLEYIKTNGAISTPQFLVQDLLKRTILKEKLIEKGYEGLLNTKILDFACGSGIFLIETFDYLQDIIVDYYMQTPSTDYDTLFFQNSDVRTLTIEGKRQLISNCIYGVDIDPEAVEVARMSLSLKVVDSSEYYENYQEIGIYGSQILNNIGNNIKCGNTLVSTDISAKYPQILSDQDQLFRTNAFDYNSTNGFSEIFNAKGGFDYIIGNPPYVEVKNYNVEYPIMHQYLKDEYQTTKNGKIDLAVAFMERAISILNDTGKLGLIVQRRFFKTDYGKKFREYITSEQLLSQVIEFESSKIFHNRVTYIATLIIDRSKPDNISFLKIDSELEEIPSTLRSIETFENDDSNFTMIPSNALNQTPWNFEDADLLGIRTTLLDQHNKFGDFANVKVGIQVLWDRAYHIKLSSINNNGTLTGSTHLEENITLEVDACRPLMVNERFYPFCEDGTSTYVIFPYDTSIEENTPIVFSEFCNRYPLTGAYLTRHKEEIVNNVETCEGDENWHLFTRVQNHKAVYPKVLLPMTANDTYATITQNPLNYCDNANMFFIEIPNKSERNLYAVAGIINSTLFSVLARSIALSQQNGYFKFNKQFIEPVPFPQFNFNTNNDLVGEISALANSIEEKQNQYKSASPRQKNTLKNLLETEWNALDSKVYELYGLTNEQTSFFDRKGRNVNRIEILDRL